MLTEVGSMKEIKISPATSAVEILVSVV
jgi:hypothetical protein